MSSSHSVVQGECISSIAFRYGFEPGFLWDHPKNQALKDQRGSPNVLRPGDRVAIPEKTIVAAPCATGRRHVFRRKAVPEQLRFQFLLAGEPRANEPYQIEIDGVLLTDEANTDSEGRIAHGISPDARIAKVRFLETEEEFVFSLGQLDPFDTIAGVKSRLRSLGFYAGPIDEVHDEALRVALETYQVARGLEPSGTTDSATQRALKDEHGA